jgi:sterol desaturase/sphingolipid hydroxylase (fatty acid hydroxylase superfamily)
MTPYILASPILEPAPWWIYTALAILSYITVDWMHLNVSWGGRRLEWFIVTPRFHHIHHSSDPSLYNLNMGNMFTIWDRLFGTFIDPDKLANTKISFGIDDESPSRVRLIVGV